LSHSAHDLDCMKVQSKYCNIITCKSTDIYCKSVISILSSMTRWKNQC